ncbi:MAG: Ig-like domain-containing protein [Clostridiaceae bacterium]
MSPKNLKELTKATYKDWIIDLLQIKKIISLMLTIVFCFMAIKNYIEPREFMSIFTVVIAFYFGQSTALNAVQSSNAVKSSNEINNTTLINGIKVKASNGSTSLKENESIQMEAIISPDNAAKENVIWRVYDADGKAQIDSNGALTAVSHGKVVVIAEAKDGSGIEGFAIITIE